jgi:hypothetical protein
MILKNKIIELNRFKKMQEAYNYGTASSMQWLIKELLQIKKNMIEGSTVNVEYTKNRYLVLDHLNCYDKFLSHFFHELIYINNNKGSDKR